MIKTPITLQDLRRKIYIKAKAEKQHRFWGLYVHICKLDTLREAYQSARRNNGAPGKDGVTFEMIEERGLTDYLEDIQKDLLNENYKPTRAKQVEIPKANGTGIRVLKIPTIRERIVEGAVKLILEPIFESDFQEGSYGYRPKRKASEAIAKVSKAIISKKTKVINIDIKSYFDTVRHDILLGKIAARVQDKQVLHLKWIPYRLKAIVPIKRSRLEAHLKTIRLFAPFNAILIFYVLCNNFISYITCAYRKISSCP